MPRRCQGRWHCLSYVTRQSVTIWEGQAQLKPIPRTGTGEMDPTLESDHGLNAGLNPQKMKQDQVGPTLSKKDQLEATLSKTSIPPTPAVDPPWGDTPPPPPRPSLVRIHNTPKGQNAHLSGSVASLLAQFQQNQQSQSWNASPKGTPAKGTPVKDTPKKDTPKKCEQMLSKKIVTPHKSAELPVKKQWTGSPSSDQGSETDCGRADKSKKKKKEPKSEPTMVTDLETEETEEQQEKCQQARKWKVELQVLKDYHESHNIFLHNLLEWGGCSHMGYLEPRISKPGTGFFIKSIKTWQLELEKQSQGIGHSVMSACHKLQKLKQMCGVKLSSLNNVCTEYLVKVFKYPGTRNRISTNAADGYGSTPMIGLYSLVEPYSIMHITTMQSRVVTLDDKKKSTSKCYCSFCDYVVQNHPSINNHFHTLLHLSLLCTIDGCFHIEHGCNNMWPHVGREHSIPSAHMAVPPLRKSKKKKWVIHQMLMAFGICAQHIFPDQSGGCPLQRCHTPSVVPNTG